MKINFRDELSHDNVNNVFNCTSDLIFMICRFSPRDGGTYTSTKRVPFPQSQLDKIMC